MILVPSLEEFNLISIKSKEWMEDMRIYELKVKTSIIFYFNMIVVLINTNSNITLMVKKGQ